MKCYALLLSAAVLAGCAAKPKSEPMPQAASPEQAAEIRAAFSRAAPSSRSGIVAEVLPDQPFAEIHEMPTDGLRPGDIISFIDTNQVAISHGTIVNIKDGNLVFVRFETGQRRPMAGDVAVKF